jgi:recombination associated protein RdgC
MWFKNLQIFQLEQPVTYDPAVLEEELHQLRFQPCAKSLPVSFGWVPPLGDEEAPLVHGESGHMIFCMQVEEKILPPAVLREEHAERVREIEKRQERKLFRDEKLRLKEELYHTLLSRAFSRHQKIYAYIDTKAGYLIIDSTSKNRIEQFLSLFTKCVTSFTCFTPDIQSPAILMTHWLKEQRAPSGLTMAYNCSLQNMDNELSTARFTHQDLLGDAVQKFLLQGAQVTQMTFLWQDQMQFTLKNNFSISSLKFLDGVQSQRQDSISETAEERFATDFIIMAETLHHFLKIFMPACAAPKQNVTQNQKEPETVEV